MNKMFILFILFFAFTLGVLEAVLPAHRLGELLFIQKFFTGMIPVLGVGALIKYLMGCSIKY